MVNQFQKLWNLYMLYKTSQWTFSVKNSKPISNHKHLILTLKVRRKLIRSDSPSGHQNTTHSVSKSFWKTLKFLYVIATNVLNKFREGFILKIGLEKFIKIRADPKVGWTVNRAVLFRSKGGLPNALKWFPKIPKLNYVILKDVGNNFHEEPFFIFGPQYSQKK